MKDLREIVYDLDELLATINLVDYDDSEIEEAFDKFFSSLNRTGQESMLKILTNVIGIDAMREVPLPDAAGRVTRGRY